MEDSKVEDKWEITAKRYVAFIDIMGFKDMVANSTHEEIYTMMKKVAFSRKLNEAVKWSDKEENLVKSTTYSDSIILYSKDDSFDAFDILVTTVAGLSYSLFLNEIPFKGAVAFGAMTLDMDNSIFFGKPLIDAYLLQEDVYYYGILFHASVDCELSEKSKNWPPFTTQYLCCLKSGFAKHMTIFPMYAKKERNYQFEKNYIKLINSIKKLRFKTSGHLRKYIDNTEQYIASLSKIKNDYD